jgi:hypothetical protein
MQDSSELGLMVNPDPRDLGLTAMPNSKAVGLGPCQTRTWVWHQTWLPDPRPLSLTLVSDPSKQHTNKQMIIVHFICQEREKKKKTYVDHTRPKEPWVWGHARPTPESGNFSIPAPGSGNRARPTPRSENINKLVFGSSNHARPLRLSHLCLILAPNMIVRPKALGLDIVGRPKDLGSAWYLNSSSLGLACLSDPSK